MNHYKLIHELSEELSQLKSYLRSRIIYYEYSIKEHEDHNNYEWAKAEHQTKEELKRILEKIDRGLL